MIANNCHPVGKVPRNMSLYFVKIETIGRRVVFLGEDPSGMRKKVRGERGTYA